MEFKYIIHYHDERLILKYQAITIKTANIKKYVENFEKQNTPYVKVLEYDLE